MSGDHYCPVEGCDFPPDGPDGRRSLKSVAAHIRNTVDDAHDWGELQDSVEQQTTTDTPSEGVEEGSDDPDEDTSDMADDEYRQQHDPDETSDEESTESDDGEDAATAAAGTAIGGLALVGRVPWWAWVGLLVVAIVVLVRNGDSSTREDDVEDTPTPPEPSAEWESDG